MLFRGRHRNVLQASRCAGKTNGAARPDEAKAAPWEADYSAAIMKASR